MAVPFEDDRQRPLSAFVSRVRAQRALVVCVGAILLAIMAYISLAYGFDAVVKMRGKHLQCFGPRLERNVPDRIIRRVRLLTPGGLTGG
jgi:hypothetical protein